MDVYTSFFCGCLLSVGGLSIFLITAYISYNIVHGAVIITEVILASCVVMLGVHLILRSLPKMIDMINTKKSCETPFYYELEPISQKRDLPPVPRNIGREYDPIVLDRV